MKHNNLILKLNKAKLLFPRINHIFPTTNRPGNPCQLGSFLCDDILGGSNTMWSI